MEKKTPSEQGKKRIRPESARARDFRVASLSLLGLLLLTTSFSCIKLTDPFEQYKDKTKNFIASYPLAAPPAAADATHDVDGFAFWDWAWRGHMNNAYEYMELSDALSTEPTSGAEVWRLELKNLMPNGDFEGSVTGSQPANWLPGNKNTQDDDSLEIVASPSATIHGKSLHVITRTNSYVYFDPTTILDIGVQERNYLMWLNISSNATAYLQQSSISDYDPQKAQDLRNSSGDNYVSSIPNAIGPASGQRILFGARSGGLDFLLDEIRILNAEATPALILRLRKGDTSPSLVGGYYKFILYARIPDDAKTSDDASRVGEALAAKNITVVVRQFPTGEDQPNEPMKASYALTTSWQKIELMGKNFEYNISALDASAKAAEVAIYPCDIDQPDAGVVLIAGPELHFYYDYLP